MIEETLKLIERNDELAAKVIELGREYDRRVGPILEESLLNNGRIREQAKENAMTTAREDIWNYCRYEDPTDGEDGEYDLGSVSWEFTLVATDAGSVKAVRLEGEDFKRLLTDGQFKFFDNALDEASDQEEGVYALVGWDDAGHPEVRRLIERKDLKAEEKRLEEEGRLRWKRADLC